MSISKDPVYNAIHNGVVRGIRVTMYNGCWGSALVLIYSAIDMMAHLALPVGQTKAQRQDFIDWADRFIDLQGNTRVTGLEWYSARCAVVHSYGVESDLTKSGNARIIGYSYDIRAHQPVLYNPSASTDIILVSINALAEGLFSGIDRFLVDAFADPEKRTAIEERLKQLFVTIDRNDVNANPDGN